MPIFLYFSAALRGIIITSLLAALKLDRINILFVTIVAAIGQ